MNIPLFDDHTILCGSYCPWLRCAWVRLFGYGVVVRDLRASPLLFSERNGYATAVRIGWLYVKVLRYDERGK